MFIALSHASQVCFSGHYLLITFLLNLLVGIVNLLSIPGFDGWQIYRLEASKKVVNALAAIVLVALILNVVPWFWSI